MKKIILSTGLLLSLNGFTQVSPLEGQESTVLNNSEAQEVWNNQKTNFESGSECFNRAMAWTYDINKKYGYEAKKILIHYSLKYNKELSAKWGFHIAPVYNVNGTDTVFDKGFQPWIHAPLTKKMWEEKFLIAGTDKLVEKRIKLKEKIKKLKEAINDLDRSSEFYYSELKSKQEKLKEYTDEMIDFKVTDADLKAQRPLKIAQVTKWIKYLSEELSKQNRSSQTYNNIKWQLDYQKDLLHKVKTNLDYAAHIQCKKITNIEELDFNLTKEWCYIQEVNQYYWGVPQLRLLNYGVSSISDIPSKAGLPEARRNGEAYVQTDFDMNYVWAARRQAFGSDYKEIWKEEYSLLESSADAVKDIDNIVDDLEDLKHDINKYAEKLVDIAKKNSKLNSYITLANNATKTASENLAFGQEQMKKIYAIAQEVSVASTQTKTKSFQSTKVKKNSSERLLEDIKDAYSKAKDKLKQIEKDERDAERERRRRERRRNRN